MKRYLKHIASILVVLMLLSPANMVASAVTASQIQNKVVDIAEGEVGYTGSSSYSKYGEWYGYQGGWCTTFAIWCYYKAGNSLGVSLYGKIVPNGGNCNSMISWYSNKGRYHTRSSGYSPQKGDFVFFDWNDSGSSDHVGIVTGTSGSTVYTIEGNCSGKVKSRSYTSTGSKPYNNISSIMGYGNPNFSAVSSGGSSGSGSSGGSSGSSSGSSSSGGSSSSSSSGSSSGGSSSSKTTQKQTTTQRATTTTTETTTEIILPTDMSLHAATYDLQIGDSVQLDYSIEPATAQAVVGYFCDEEDVLKISNGGEITALNEGKATVVVCANDEIYRQVDFNVTRESVGVTQHSANIVDTGEQKKATVNKSTAQKLHDIGINLEQLVSHKNNYKYPLYILSATVALSAVVVLIRKLVIRHKNKKKNDENDENV